MYVPVVHLTGFANGKWSHPLPEAVRQHIRKKSTLWKKYLNGTVGEKYTRSKGIKCGMWLDSTLRNNRTL